jgi:hypothetical protein
MRNPFPPGSQLTTSSIPFFSAYCSISWHLKGNFLLVANGRYVNILFDVSHFIVVVVVSCCDGDDDGSVVAVVVDDIVVIFKLKF